MGGYPDNTDDVIDSRDVIEAIGQIESEINSRILDALNPNEDASWSDVADANIDAADGINVLPEDLWPDGLDDDVKAELWDLANVLVPLRKLASQGENYAADWQYGEALINDDHFEDYAKDLAEDIGAINKDAAWPACHIDWEAAADALKGDYTEVDFDGVTYWVR